jgi:hypothetical protein
MPCCGEDTGDLATMDSVYTIDCRTHGYLEAPLPPWLYSTDSPEPNPNPNGRII